MKPTLGIKKTHRNFPCILYHEAKMLACKGIFAKPSIAQPRHSAERRSRGSLRSGIPCAYYTMKQKCLLARAFLRSRQLRSRAIARSGEAVEACEAGFPAHIIPCLDMCVNFFLLNVIFIRFFHILSVFLYYTPFLCIKTLDLLTKTRYNI